MKISKAKLIQIVHTTTQGAPKEVLEVAQAYIEALDDSPGDFKFDLKEAQRVWDEDLGESYGGKYPLKA